MKKHPVMTIILIGILFLLAYTVRQRYGRTAAVLTAPTSGSGFSLLSQPMSSSAPRPSTTAELKAQLLEGMLARETVVTIYGVKGDAVKSAFRELLAEHPELFWLTGNANLRTTTVGSESYVEITPDMNGTAREIERKAGELEAAVDRLLGALPVGASDYEKILWLHDRIVNETEYDHRIYVRNGKEELGDRDAHCAYGCLVNRVAVCEGYARAYQLLLGRLGVPCGFVEGSARDGGSHAWNWVTLDGTSFYVDVTWDDPTVTGGSGRSVCTHAYFGITEEELLRTHIIDGGQTLPVCDSVRYDYYRCSGLYIDSDDAKTAAEAILSRADSDTAEFKFAKPYQREAAVQALLVGGGLYDYAGAERIDGLQYSQDKNGLVLRIFF